MPAKARIDQQCLQKRKAAENLLRPLCIVRDFYRLLFGSLAGYQANPGQPGTNQKNCRGLRNRSVENILSVPPVG